MTNEILKRLIETSFRNIFKILLIENISSTQLYYTILLPPHPYFLDI